MFAAVFLDIHNQDLLSNEQMDKAWETEINVALRMKGINIEVTEETNDVSREDDSMGENIDSDSDEEMSKVRKSKKEQDSWTF